MNRRNFLGQFVFGSAVASTTRVSLSAQAIGGLQVKFVGMMAYISRSDGSMLVAMPGMHTMGHYSHVPFLMARAGSPIAAALGLANMPGVVAAAFDMSLVDAAGPFVFRCLDGADVDIQDSAGARGVTNRATQLAHMQAIAPGKRLRQNLRRWSQSMVTINGGTLDNSSAHPDAGKVWSFGSYKQQLTDATLYRSQGATVRLNAGAQVHTFTASDDRLAELWIVSAAAPSTQPQNPKRLEHGHLLFEFFADAQAVIPTCEEATGRITYPTELPCAGGALASLRPVAASAAPPHTEMCPGGGWCCE